MIKIRPVPPAVNPYSFSYLISTWLQSGRIRPVSGTWGTLAAVPFCWAVSSLFGVAGLIVFAALVFVAGVNAVAAYLPLAKQADPSEVVVDEVVGLAIAWAFIPANHFWWMFFAFVLFRIFDSIKFGPVGWCDKNIKGALGVMTDDVVAGGMAGLTLLIFRLAFQAW